MDNIKFGPKGFCGYCNQPDYGGHEHCEEAHELINAPGGIVWTLRGVQDADWRCWTILAIRPDQLLEKCCRDFPGRTVEQWELTLRPVQVRLERIPEEYRPTLPWSKPWLKR